VTSPGHSYGGYKESGIGREFSLEGMLESYMHEEECHCQPDALKSDCDYSKFGCSTFRIGLHRRGDVKRK